MNIKKIITIFLGLIAIVMIGFGVYVMNSSKYIFKTGLDRVFDFMLDKYSETEVLDYDKFKLTTNNKVTMSAVEVASVDGEIYADIPNFNFYVDVDSNVMNQEFVSLQTLVKDEKVYLKIKEVMENFYYENIEMSGELSDIDYKQIKLSESEVELLFKYLKDSILKDLSDKDFDRKSETVVIENKNYKTTKIGLKITQKRLVKIIEEFLTSIANDKRAIQILQKFDKTITKDDIQEVIKSFKDMTAEASNDEIFNFAFYVEGFGTLRRIEFTSPDNKTDSYATKAGVKLDVHDNSYKNKTYLLAAYTGDTTVALVKIEYTSKTKANLLLDVDTIKIEGTMDNSKNSQNIKLSLAYEGNNVGTLDYTYTIVKEDKEYQMDVIVNVSSMVEITSNNTLLLDEALPSIDIDDALPMEDMSEKEQAEIKEYFEGKLDIFNALGFNEDSNDDSIEELYDTFWYEEISVDEMKDLMSSETPIILWLGSQYCSHCATFSEVLDASVFDYQYDIYYIDVTVLTESDLNGLKGIDSRLENLAIPTTLVLQNGKVKEIKRGAMTKDEYYSFLDSLGIKKV